MRMRSMPSDDRVPSDASCSGQTHTFGLNPTVSLSRGVDAQTKELTCGVEVFLFSLFQS